MHDPVAYRVTAMRESLSAQPLLNRQVITEKYPDLEKASARKAELQAQGMIATVTPIFVRRRWKKMQTTPWPDFRKEWKLFGEIE